MRIGVIGAGAVGGAIAALLDRAGHEVSVTARGEHLEAITTRGLALSGAWGTHVARVHASAVLEGAQELVILATKAQDATAALTDNAAFLRGIPIVIVQNGLDGVTGARRAAPHSDLVGALAMFASSYLSPGQIVVTAAAPLYLGQVHADGTGADSTGDGGDSREHDIPVRYAAAALQSALPVEMLANFEGAQWTKLVVNHINALPAITGLSAQEVIADAGLRRVMTRSMRETVRLALRNGVRFDAIQGLTHRRLQLFAVAPLWLGDALPRRFARRMGSVPNPGSTLQSIRRGQLTEIDYLNGAVVAFAESRGEVAPVNAAIVTMVHRVEASGEFLSRAEVVATATD